MQVILTYLPFVLPPLLGAVIGYVTNAIAIRMLFRPHREIRILGVKLPLTPGIIPKQRYDLAESLGKMVSRELLTADAISSHLENPELRSNIQSTIKKFTESMVSKPLGALPELFLGDGDEIGPLLSEVLRGFINSPGWERMVGFTINRIMDSFGEKKLADLLPEDRDPGELVGKLISRILSEDSRNRVLEWLDEIIHFHVSRNTPIGELLSAEDAEEVVAFLDGAYPKFSSLLITWLNAPDARQELEIRGVHLLRIIIGKLTSLQKFLLTAGQYDKTLMDNMPEIVSDALTALDDGLKDPKNQKRVRESIDKWIGLVRQVGVRDICLRFGILPQREVHHLARKVLEAFLKLSQSSRFRDRLSNLMPRLKEKSIFELLTDLLGQDKQGVRDKVTGFVVPLSRNIILKPETSAGTFARDFFGEFREVNIREITGLQDGLKQRIDEAVTQKVLALFKTRITGILESLDIQTLVTDKVNSLDVAQVEDLLMYVIKKHLKWINVFGALLGSLIGALQVITNYFL